jgi:hypothetical protein
MPTTFTGLTSTTVLKRDDYLRLTFEADNLGGFMFGSGMQAVYAALASVGVLPTVYNPWTDGADIAVVDVHVLGAGGTSAAELVRRLDAISGAVRVRSVQAIVRPQAGTAGADDRQTTTAAAEAEKDAESPLRKFLRGLGLTSGIVLVAAGLGAMVYLKMQMGARR